MDWHSVFCWAFHWTFQKEPKTVTRRLARTTAPRWKQKVPESSSIITWPDEQNPRTVCRGSSSGFLTDGSADRQDGGDFFFYGSLFIAIWLMMVNDA